MYRVTNLSKLPVDVRVIDEKGAIISVTLTPRASINSEQITPQAENLRNLGLLTITKAEVPVTVTQASARASRSTKTTSSDEPSVKE